MKKKLLSSTIKLALVSSVALSLQGCIDGETGATSVTNSSNEVGNVTNNVQVLNPVGTVIGVVQDIQGNPISGATVSIGGRSVKTSTGGTYQFDDIPVTDVVVNALDINRSNSNAVIDDQTGSTLQQALILTIVPPSGYLGATVTVTAPAAVIDYGNGGSSCANVNTGGGDSNCSAINTNTFLNGFIAQAGNAILPTLNASISGVLRDSSTGRSLANTEISFEMTGTYGLTSPDGTVLSGSGNHDDVRVSYAVSNLTTTTDDNGNFTIENVPSKSSMEPKVSGYTADDLPNNVYQGQTNNSISTQDWTSNINVGAMMFEPIIPDKDVISPFVIKVDSVTNGTPGLFSDDIDVTAAGSGIVIYFNEAISNSVDTTILENSVEVFVWDDMGDNPGDGVYDFDESASGSYVTPSSLTLATDRKSMVVVLPTNLTEGQSVHVNLLTIDFTDAAGNQLTDNNTGSVNYDSTINGASSGNGQFIRLAISTFVEINKTAPAVTLTQLTEDTTGIDDDADLTAINSVFTDVRDGDNLVSNLNATDDDGGLSSEVASRLNALRIAIGGAGNGMDTNQALVSFTPNSSNQYIMIVEDENGINQGGLPINDLAGNLLVSLGSPFSAFDSNPVNLVINSVKAGWSVKITSMDDLGYFGGQSLALELVDSVPPTTVLQSSYGVGLTSDYMVTADTFGDGGELVNAGNVGGGTPYLNVTAQMLDNLDADGNPSVLAGVGGAGQNDNSLKAELTDNNVVDSTTGLPFITVAYDSSAYTAMAAAAARKIGIAFSENITYVKDPTFTGTAGLTGWAALNDVRQQDDGTGNNVDLMTADITSVFTLASDNGVIINFDGAVADSSSNLSATSANPNVVVRDALPPFITGGSYKGDDITLIFNEAIVVKNGDAIVFDDGTSAVLSVFPDNGDLSLENYSYNASTNTLTINSSAWGGNMRLPVAFSLPAYPAPSLSLEHGTINFSSIEDVNGNKWSGGGGYGIVMVPYALETSIEPINAVVTTSTGAVAAATSFTAIYTTEHRIDMTTFGVAADTTTLTAAQVIANFALTGTGVIEAAGTGATLSTNGRELTVTVNVSVTPVVAGDTFDLTSNGGQIDSDWDNNASQSVTPTTITIQ